MKKILLFVLLAAFRASTLEGGPPKLPVLVSGFLPIYPEQDRAAHTVGTVKLWFLLDATGQVTHADVISGHPFFAKPALESVKSWKFDPHQLGSAEKRYETEFVYTLKPKYQKGPPTLTVSMADFRHVEVTSETYVVTNF